MRKILMKIKNFIYRKLTLILGKKKCQKYLNFDVSHYGCYLNDYIFKKKPNSKKRLLKTKWKFHDIQEIFDRLNNEHYYGEVTASITYSNFGRKSTGIRKGISLATYSVQESLIRIHPILDSEKVPEYFIEQIIHHEMLHEVLPPVMGKNNKWQIHHRDFREAEALTPTFLKAMKWLERNNNMFFNKNS